MYLAWTVARSNLQEIRDGDFVFYEVHDCVAARSQDKVTRTATFEENVLPVNYVTDFRSSLKDFSLSHPPMLRKKKVLFGRPDLVPRRGCDDRSSDAV